MYPHSLDVYQSNQIDKQRGKGGIFVAGEIFGSIIFILILFSNFLFIVLRIVKVGKSYNASFWLS